MNILQPHNRPIDIPAKIPSPDRGNQPIRPIIPTPNRGKIKG